MSDPMDVEREPYDRELREWLRRAEAPLATEPFVGGVMRRVRRRIWIRRVVLGFAVTAGLAIAGGPLLELAAGLEALSQAWTSRPSDAAWLEAYGFELALGAAALLWPALVRWLAR